MRRREVVFIPSDKMFTKLIIFSFSFLLVHADLYHGQSDVFGRNMVIGGKNAAISEFPHQVSLQWGHIPYTPFQHTCGGSIISERWILTAGHCVVNMRQYGQFVVKAGKIFLKARERMEQIVNVEQIIIHKQYKGNVMPFDIALLKLSGPLKFNKYVTPISLPQADFLPTGNVVLSGWGSTSRTMTPFMPDFLQKVTLPLIDLDTCRDAFEKLGDPWKVHDTNICTGPLTGGSSACNGDSGGPLIGYINGRTELVGIVSWGHVPCGAVGAPAVFIRVSAFIDWIHYVMNIYN